MGVACVQVGHHMLPLCPDSYPFSLTYTLPPNSLQVDHLSLQDVRQGSGRSSDTEREPLRSPKMEFWIPGSPQASSGRRYCISLNIQRGIYLALMDYGSNQTSIIQSLIQVDWHVVVQRHSTV